MKRLHVHVSVDRLVESITFYSSLFAAQPSVIKDDYAKWMLDDPRVNFVISERGAALGLDHLGIQVKPADELGQMQSRLASVRPDLEKDECAACCYAKSDKYWVTDPTGIAWETFQTLGTIRVFGESRKDKMDSAACCAPVVKPSTKGVSMSCCTPSSTFASTSSCC
ncbi:MAG TPA: ArsI/CadI family heavy metal resistance metalloenzyme [Eoetvoesiella sp.]